MKKFIVRLKGGLGNQLFQYSTARRIAIINDAELIIDNITGFKYDKTYKRKYSLHYFNVNEKFVSKYELLEPLGLFRRYIDKKLSFSNSLSNKKYIVQKGTDYQPKLLNIQLNNNVTYFDGFGQSENYFYDIKDILLNELFVKDVYKYKFVNDLCNNLDCETIALHIRWFSTSYSSNLTVPKEYYINAINKIVKDNITKNFFLYIFTDNEEKTKIYYKEILINLPYLFINAKNFNYEFDDFIFDFQIMKSCRHFIIGNSTFSWWAAWLKEQDDPSTKVIAPSLFINNQNNITAWGFPYQLPSRWTLL